MKQNFFQRLKHYWSRIWLHPIQVFVFHQVSDVFEPETMWECDWTQTNAFKQRILALKKKYTFISLTEVQRHLAQDKWRFRNYASLTADDGWASLTNILPWLVEQKIPVPLFLNPSCLDGKHWNSRETDKLLTREEVVRFVEQGAPYITIASHGWTHKSSLHMTMEEFIESVDKSERVLQEMPAKVPFFAYASGLSAEGQFGYLRKQGLTPVYVDRRVNSKDSILIHRYCIDGGINHE